MLESDACSWKDSWRCAGHAHTRDKCHIRRRKWRYPVAAVHRAAARGRPDPAGCISQRYTADHPDVRALERTVRELQAKLQEEAKNPGSPRPGSVSPEEAARRKRIPDPSGRDHRDRSPDCRQWTEDAANLKGTIAGYQAKVDALPARESELVELTRDYTTLQQTYASLLQKQEDSKLAANLERRQIGEQFKVLDPASLSAEACTTRGLELVRLRSARPLVWRLVLASSSFSSIATPVSRSKNTSTRLIGLPVLALIPQMEAADGAVMRRLRRNAFLGAAATVVALVCAGALLVWKGPA